MDPFSPEQLTTKLTLVVIRVADIERSASLYSVLGLRLTKERHGKGPEHYSATIGGLTFELYPLRSSLEATNHARLGFSVDKGSLDAVIAAWTSEGGTLVLSPKPSPWGTRAVVQDFDGHKVEFIERV